MQLTQRYTKEQLRKTVAESTNIRQVCLRSGLRGRGANYSTIRRHIAQENLDTSHFSSDPRRAIAVQRRLFDERPVMGRRPFPATVEELEVAVASRHSLAAVARELGMNPTGGKTYRDLKYLIEKHGLDTSHFLGQAWSRGRRVTCFGGRPLQELLVKGSSPTSSSLRLRLLSEGVKEARCEGCGMESWQGHPIPLELDHINGDRYDNRLENLRVLCPNCHALTANYRARNIGRKTSLPVETNPAIDGEASPSP